MDKLGVFLCTGCGIGDAIDVDAVIEAADGPRVCYHPHPRVPVRPRGARGDRRLGDRKRARRHSRRRLLGACQDRGVQLAHQADGMVMFRAAVREHCAWPLKEAEDDEDKTAAAPGPSCRWVSPVSTA